MFELAIGSIFGSLFSSAASLFTGYSAQKKQEKAQKEAFELQQKQEQYKIQQLKRQSFERGRIVRAQSFAAQTNSGAGAPDSSAIGGSFSVTSQANSNIAALNAQSSFQDAAGEVNDIFASAARLKGVSNTFGGVADLFNTGANAAFRFQ
jgi:beta-glucosidase-like glycosyl hydrolase